jgi:hypothetical protein
LSRSAESADAIGDDVYCEVREAGRRASSTWSSHARWTRWGGTSSLRHPHEHTARKNGSSPVPNISDVS